MMQPRLYVRNLLINNRSMVPSNSMIVTSAPTLDVSKLKFDNTTDG